jgi:hypothetical protein
MQFIIGVIFFVVIVGIIDSGIPWPSSKPDRSRQ